MAKKSSSQQAVPRTGPLNARTVPRSQADQSQRPPAAPPAYRPEVKKVAQAKLTSTTTSATMQPKLTPNCRPPQTTGVLQRKETKNQSGRYGNSVQRHMLARPPLSGTARRSSPWIPSRAVVQRAEAPSQAGAQPYHCKRCGYTILSPGFPETNCPKCNATFAWVKGEAAANSNIRPWEKLVRACQMTAAEAADLTRAKAKNQPFSKRCMRTENIQELIRHCKALGTFLTAINTAEDIYDIDTIKKLLAGGSFRNEQQITYCYEAIRGMLLALTRLNDREWNMINQCGGGGALVSWLTNKKGCVTSLAEDLLRVL